MAALDNLGKALARMRDAKRVTLQQLADRMGYADKSSVKALESRNPTAENLGRYLDALGCNLHDLADALDAVNQRGIHAPSAITRAQEIAERSPIPGVSESAEMLSSLIRQLSLALESNRELRRQLDTKG